MKLGYILLVHEPFELLRPLLDTLTQFEDLVVLHYDLAVPHANDIELIKQHYPNILFAKRIAVEWGEASIVQATLNGMQAIVDSGEVPLYISLLSGSCFPIKSRDLLVKHLSGNIKSEFIECHDIAKSQWVKDGLEWARWEYFHFYNWRKNPRLFSLSEKIQKKMKIKRRFPLGDKMVMGSQWWTLSYSMIEKLLTVTKQHKLMQFVNRTWIPDEFYFQTLVANLVDNKSTIKKPLMNYRFNHTGIPKIYTRYDLNELKSNKSFFTRKIKHTDTALTDVLNLAYCNGIEIVADNKQNQLPAAGFGLLREHSFINWIYDYKLPIFIFVTKKSDRATVFNKLIQHKIPNFPVYGHLLAHNAIDYLQLPPISLYPPKAVKIRDYSHHEFFTHISVKAEQGFGFCIQSHKLPPVIDEFKKCKNVAFIDICDDLNVVKDSLSLESYLQHTACSYSRVTTTNAMYFELFLDRFLTKPFGVK